MGPYRAVPMVAAAAWRMAAAFALSAGPLQFSERLRRKYLTVHKVIGYLYTTGCYLGAPLGIYIQWFIERLGGSRSFTIATVMDAGIWIFATTMALYLIRAGKMQQHRQWMIRSFALRHHSWKCALS